ncbi:hypothetical protein SASPL_107928 [Salvia splendens]|uniref:Uncharacterized protein n=1 Tax=Salvia splendens TaxID=180675 RepID=A0A8X8YHT9_SALSN|nr:hypothetical protein SASPL_107928 [Salvia splendens]
MDLLRDKTLKVKEERGLKHHQPTPNSSKSPISGETLTNFRCLHKLESLKIHFPFCISRYPMDLLSKRLGFPTCLNKLHLINCSLTRVDLATIGSLPHLQVIELEHISVLGGEWSAVAGDFPCLKYLRINSCDLVYWGVEASAFGVLERLIVEDLWQLKEIRAEMGEINTLNLICVHHCSESAAISAMEIKRALGTMAMGFKSTSLSSPVMVF